MLQRTNGPAITESRLREWAIEETPDAIAEALKLEGKDYTAAKSALQSLRLIDSPNADLKAAVSALVDAQMCATDPPKIENARNAVLNELREPYRQPPGDALFLSAFASGHGDGYFVYLRHLEQVWEQDISVGTVHRNAQYRRIARLEDRFIHSLVQRFALVFMMIGLPDQYEEMRDLHAASIGDYLE